MATQAFCLKRNNHLNDMVVDLEEMLKDENMVDVALSCEEGIIKAHKIILSACSTYFRQIFSKVQLNNQYPIIIIKDMSYQDLKYIVDFIYRGEITVPQNHLNSVLKSAEALKIKGLADVNNENNQTNRTTNKVDDEHQSIGNRKKKKKRRKINSDEQMKKDKLQNSSEEVTDYTDDDDILVHNQNTQSTTVQSHQTLSSLSSLNAAQNIIQQQSTSTHHNSPALNETEIEPSRLLEQTMITGDVCLASFHQILSNLIKFYQIIND